jgi:hypothetical protein
MQRELSVISSSVSATREFIAPFPVKSRQQQVPSDAPSPKTFGPWFPSQMQRSASSGGDTAGSAGIEWDDVLSASCIESPVIIESESRLNDAERALLSASEDEYSADRPQACNRQLHVLPDVSLQELLMSLNFFSLWLQTASFKGGNGVCDCKYVDTGICNDVLVLYKAIFGINYYERNCMYLMFADSTYAMELFFQKVTTPRRHSTTIEPLNVFRRTALSSKMQSLWQHFDCSVCIVRCLRVVIFTFRCRRQLFFSQYTAMLWL